MQLKVVHVTGYSYTGGVVASYNEARLTPLSSHEQLVISSRVDISPSAWTNKYVDYWGTQVTAFEVHELHHELTGTGTSTVEVTRGTEKPEGLSWEEVRDPKVADDLCELLEVGARIRASDDLAARAAALEAEASGPSDFALKVCGLVHDEVRYVAGATEVSTTARDSWEAREGVCQDMAHLCLGVLRSAGIPARYVSGYLHPDLEPIVGSTVTGESHAWIEWWDGAWVGFDPTNDAPTSDRHVVVARGRDYGDVAPLTGIFSGGETSSMFVEVHITRLS
jgi:transglutaminase-like putative cysteine protease